MFTSSNIFVLIPEALWLRLSLRYFFDILGECEVNDSPVTGFWEHFVHSPNSLWWKTVIGVVGNGCGDVHDDQSLHFGSEGSRILETISLQTSTIRYYAGISCDI